MVKGLRSGGKFWRGVVVEGLAILAVVLLVTSGRINSLETRSAESRSAESRSAESRSAASSHVPSDSSQAARAVLRAADDAEFTASDDAVERQLRRASTRLQQLLTRHWQRVEQDLRNDLDVVKK
jgi:hypothetical protein